MKYKSLLEVGSRIARFPYRKSFKSLGVFALLLTGSMAPLQAQEETFTKPSWWFGAAVGGNINFYEGSTQQLNSDLTLLKAFDEGAGVGLFLAPLVEFHRPESRWGFMLQAGYDNRKGAFDEVTTPCNCPADLSANQSYITVEPSLRLAPFKSNFYLFVGPRVAFNLESSFNYQLGVNAGNPEQLTSPEIKGDFDNVRKTVLSMQIGAGYDIPLSSQNKRTQMVLSPFVSFHPYFGQDPRTVETWNVTTLRAGVAFKFGRGKVNTPEETDNGVLVVKAAEVEFFINSPKNIPTERRVRETFPLRNYIFFDLGSTNIPDRYVLLTVDQVKDFKEDQLEVFKPKRLSGRSDREMTVYYNVLNILGDRMSKNPSTKIKLVGSADNNPAEGKIMAASVKLYLVSVFGIDAKRITIEGRSKPKIPSRTTNSTDNLDLILAGERRVSIESSSPILLMEFQSGKNIPLKPVEYGSVQQAPIDSYVTFNAVGAISSYKSWSLEVKDAQGIISYYGPFYREHVSMPGKAILGTMPVNDYMVTMVGIAKNGDTIRKQAPMHLVLWTAPKPEEGMRYSIIYEINSAKSIRIYKKYLTEIVIPKIPIGAKVILSGYTDIIGEADYNETLSLARANDAKTILQEGLMKAGRNDVVFEVYGFGEDLNYAPFGNEYPEERFYNRSVIIDIIPFE